MTSTPGPNPITSLQRKLNATLIISVFLLYCNQIFQPIRMLYKIASRKSMLKFILGPAPGHSNGRRLSIFAVCFLS